MKVISVNLGKRKTVTWKHKTYETGIYKYPVNEPIFLGETDVERDDVIDRKYHGGIEQAVYAYGENHYDFWKNLYPQLEFNFGIFGENLTVKELWEENIFVGDVYKLGETILEVTKPREPCVKLGIRFNDANVIKQFWETTKSGVYFKVLKTGHVKCDDEFILHKISKNTPSIAEVFQKKGS
ncbi:MOSC domain-containing protein [Namhaeicola litoreus]|uniref:MOSC domain-containing protein n=1 Tax=Namhaeicola litoreus TaxID=1052145 RepID=A0ABW3Y3K9_9FLAO